ncbi:asparagine synthase [Burkholderia stabilis]|uniref:asparagine synthase-related protein n=1 Tax=Burkholderia stabilis TaxID=95485 RepID=UPI000851D4AD|nr:asparagine synthase-related protein [Burkholderia stabilis]AOR66641.1 asparagine synthase [Burkholderia stabilis]HDR9493282.1 asparagine synthase [Burkholderia stabilis]HDR9525269.1 asparagine synthase [Burkholderia stabilis]HDR9532915.1 asparagine synthase [Burkholderia stabilis]HDR9540313.1 asparagine synthase [Burkholderia stabilis]
MIVGTRDLFGFDRLHYHPRSGVSASGIGAVLHAAGQPAGAPDATAIAGYLSGARLVGRTVLRDVLAVPPGHALLRSPQGLAVQPAPERPQHADLETVLRASLQRALDSGKRVALALSGGLDSALLLALLRELGAQQHVTSYILATDMPDYCERDAALELATQMQATVKIVRVTEADFVAALPRTTHAVEEPMFNLHPVAKLLLAEAMAADGVEVAITGDGADQVLRRDQSANYLPLCHALFDAASVDLHPPFVDAAVVAHLTSIAPDPNKQCLRDLGARLNLPDRLVHGPKRGRLAPAMDLTALLDRDRARALADMLGLAAPALEADTERVLWTTLTLILDHFDAAHRPT